MRNIAALLVLVVTLLLTGCEGSDTYQGSWKASSANGNKNVITFFPKEMKLKTETGEEKTFTYSQNSVSIKNGKRSYGINLNNGLSYKIGFPIRGNTEKGYIADENDNILYIIGKDHYYTYNDIFGLDK